MTVEKRGTRVVWFGLSHFWSLAQRGSAFRAERVEARLAIARGGFEKGPLEERIADYVPHIAPPLLELVREMQAQVAVGSWADR